jgi:hypothetical protein
MEDQERKKKYFLLHKWKIIKVKKDEMLKDKIQKYKKISRSTEMAKIVLVGLHMKKIF